MSGYEDYMSSDGSEDDDYNYLTVLDNMNWSSHHHIRSNNENDNIMATNESNRQLSITRNRADVRPTAKPAIAVKTKCNRSEHLFKDMMASNRDNKHKTNDNKRESDDMCDDMESVLIEKPKTCSASDSGYDSKISGKSVNNNKRLKGNDMNKQSEYSVEEVLQRKKANHQKIVNNNTKSDLNRVKSDRMFGKAFSPTVYSPEVPVMRPQVNAQNVAPLGSLNRRSLTLNDEVSDTKYSFDGILAVILDWNTKWLVECVANEVPPPLSPFGEGIGVQTSYESLDEYQSAYIPLILFETWAQIFEEYHRNKSSSTQFKAVLSPEYSANDDNFITISFQSVIHKKDMKTCQYPNEGQLILLDMTIECNQNESRKVRLFGYVWQYNLETISSNTQTLPGLVVGPKASGQMLLKYVVVISKKNIRINTNVEIGVQSCYYLKPTLRQIELISGLNACPLFKDILKPRSFTCQMVVPTVGKCDSVNFNESQHKAIVGSNEILHRLYLVTKLLLIQGPPGTGKTHTLIGIIKRIYMTWTNEERMPRILICAPSNGAVDEIARRLYRERGFLHKHKVDRSLRIVRIGLESHIHPDVRSISLEATVDRNLESELKNVKQLIDKQHKDLENKISELEQQSANLRATKGDNKAALANNDDLMAKYALQLQEIGSKPKAVKSSRSRMVSEVMAKADIIISTLNSCHQSSIENLYKMFGPKTFDCVLVDEASQCSEPELLMPLAYRMTKMILIGDPMQLPATIISKKAQHLQLGRSLFERFYHYFRQIEAKEPTQKSPILMLTDQYRMHPQICDFPSKHFYDGRLVSNEKLTKSRVSKLKPYVVFDVTDTKENSTDPTNKYNESEAKFVIRLLSLIDRILCVENQKNEKNVKHWSVGVITPYNGQKHFLNNKIKDLELKSKLNVEVNTVDGFQGQERDIIILSCVRAFDSNNHSNSIGFLNSIQRMNVALTRAKYSMIVCISGRSLENDKNWKSLIDNAFKRTHCRFKVTSTLADSKLEKMLHRVDKIDEILCD